VLGRFYSRPLKLAIPLIGLLTLGAAPPSVPKRIVSLNMCADQLIIALADPQQIAGLTEWARDPMLSYYADRAQRLPFTHRSTEEVMALKPDLVIGAPYRTKAVLAPLKARGTRLLQLPNMKGYASLEESITTVATAVGHPERGRALIHRIETELAALGPAAGHGRVAAYYQRQGYLTGTGTLIDDMMRRAGLVNLADHMGRSSLSQISLEEMALARPDFLVMDAGTRTADDRGSAMLHHPLLDSAVPPSHHLYIPQALTVCGTPGYPKAVAMLMGQIRAADAQATR
jgi:iron complex transport system substrate-binding protein